MKSESNIKDVISFNNQSQDLNFRVNHYKFLSELNSTQRNIIEKENSIFLKKKMIQNDKKETNENKDIACFIF